MVKLVQFLNRRENILSLNLIIKLTMQPFHKNTKSFMNSNTLTKAWNYTFRNSNKSFHFKYSMMNTRHWQGSRYRGLYTITKHVQYRTDVKCNMMPSNVWIKPSPALCGVIFVCIRMYIAYCRDTDWMVQFRMKFRRIMWLLLLCDFWIENSFYVNENL